jgi:hypothetical protein
MTVSGAKQTYAKAEVRKVPTADSYLLQSPKRVLSAQCRSRSWSTVNPAAARTAQSFLGPVMLGSQGNLGQRRRPKHTHRSVVASFQKRKRNPTVGAMLLRWRKPEANPPFTCVNMIPE